MTKFKEFLSKRKHQILQSTLVAFILPFILFVSLPMEIFSNNLDEFNFALNDFIWSSLLLVFLFTLLFFVILFVLPNKANKIVCFCLLSLEFMLFLQGTYLNAGANSLGGDNMGKVLPVFSIVLNSILWVGIIATFVVLACLKDKKGIIKIGSMIVVAILIMTQLVTLVTASTKENVFSSKYERMQAIDENYESKNLTNYQLASVSNQDNIFYFVVDRFDEDYAIDAYNRKPEIFDALDGFTWFQDYISLYGHTFPAVTSMLTDKKIDLETQKRVDYFETAYSGDTPLSELQNNGYDINLYTQEYYAFNGNELPDFVNNFNTGKFLVKDHFKLSFSMAAVAVARCVPLAFKNMTGANVNSNTCNYACRFVGDNNELNYVVDNKDVYNFLKGRVFENRSNKLFSFIHIEGCHSTNYDADFKNLGIFDKKDMIYSVENSFKIIKIFIDALKSANMYESATIIITGDHSAPHNDFSAANQPRQTALFVKPADSADSALEISNAQVAQKDLWPTIFKDKSISSSVVSGESVFEISESTDRTREFIWQTYEGSRTQEFTYQIVGSGADFENYSLIDTKTYDHFVME